MKSLAALCRSVPAVRFCGADAGTCVPQSLVSDSRRVIPGALFVAMPGLHVRGSDFAAEAVKRGAIAVVAGTPLELPAHVAQAIVPNVAQAAALIAREFYGVPAETADAAAARGEKPFPIIGVTGTNGKTSVTSLFRFLIAPQAGAIPGLIGTVRYELGRRSIPSYKTTPEALDLAKFFAEMREANCAGAVMEVSSHAISQNRVYGIPFEAVAFTNLTQDHMDYHGNMENYFAVKSRLFDGSQGAFPKSAVINADDAYGRRLLATLPAQTKAFAFGLQRPPKMLRGRDRGFFAQKIELSPAGSTFELHCAYGIFEVKTSLPGEYNVSNVLCALALVAAVGGNVRRAVGDIPYFRGVPGRMERVPAGTAENSGTAGESSEKAFPFDVFVDYAHTDDALANVLGMLKKIVRGRLLVVFGCGGNRDRGKRPKMVRAVQKFADFAWATSDNPRKEPLEQIFADMRAGVDFPEKIEFEPDRRRAIGRAIESAGTGDCVLIAGKGHENYQEFADITLPFDDKAVAAELLSLLRSRLRARSRAGT